MRGKKVPSPTTPGAVSRINGSPNCNNAVFKLDLQLPIVVADFIRRRKRYARRSTLAFTNLSKTISQATYSWSFGDGGTSTAVNPTHTYIGKGTFNVTLIVTDPGSCNGADTITKQVMAISPDANDTLPTLDYLCLGQGIQIGIATGNDSDTYSWSPSTGLSQTNVSNPVASPQDSTTYRLLYFNGMCTDTVFQTVLVYKDAPAVTGGNILCPYDTIQLSVTDTSTQKLTYAYGSPPCKLFPAPVLLHRSLAPVVVLLMWFI